ncbi:hypothetical protein CPG37_07110 [Malaciobacter canalis]|uniref:Phage protein n=2 Tax=Malaciobacter canalis TaxID=1912871 RepID=A0ABX4LQ24_9BACT|nr:hypothetical protein CPG37_07110 [Malaciobacter canalis]
MYETRCFHALIGFKGRGIVMEVKFVFEAWQLILALVSIVSAFAVNTYMTKQNNAKTKQHESKLSDLQDKCNEMMKETEARKTFVTRELFFTEIKHLNKDVKEVKETTNKILECVQK